MTTKLALLVSLMGCVAPATEGVIDQEIVGGTRVTTTDFPTVVALQHGAGNWFCSGTLVDKDWVLTAASCFDNNDATQVRVGDADLTDGTTAGQTIAVTEIRKHPQFSLNDTVWRHDVALLKLATSVTDRTPTPIQRTSVAVGSAITQAGFGESNNSGGGGGQLRSLGTATVDCADADDSGITNANLLCFNAADGTGSCYGDGGAPSFTGTGTSRAVAGVASGGTGNSCTSGLDIYTALAAELTFIDTYVPVPTTPTTPTTPTPPPDNNPDGSGSGSSDPRDPPDDGKRGPARAVGCNAGGAAGWLAALGVALMVAGRRRRRT
jgi:trypsin